MEREFTMRSLLLPQGLTERTKDFILAIGIALVGCIGSYFILGGSIRSMILSNEADDSQVISYQKDASLHGLDEKIKQNVPTSDGNSLLLVHGTMRVNEMLQFNNLHMSNNGKYLIDFGNGIRTILLENYTNMKYSDPGIYIAQSFIWENNHWKLIAAQTLTIHP
jgi:hypothetical protein